MKGKHKWFKKRCWVIPAREEGAFKKKALLKTVKVDQRYCNYRYMFCGKMNLRAALA